MYEAQIMSDGWVKKAEDSWYWYWRNGRELRFDKEGLLGYVQTPSKTSVNLIRDRKGKLIQVSDPQSRTIAFDYYKNNRLKSIVSPEGKIIRYRYDSNSNLVSVEYPDKSTRNYHYEDQRHINALTGITDARNVRLASYNYDDSGKAVLSTHANSKGKVSLVYHSGKTLVTDENNKVSTYLTEIRNGIALVNEMHGQGCSGCNLSGNQTYKYNDQFQLIETADKNNIKVKYEYDALGRLIKIAQTGSNNSTKVLREFKYTQRGLQPIIVKMPSVAPGKEHVFAMEYNPGGQVTKITEFGFRPDGTDNFVEIRRAKSYKYDANGKLLMVDGPAAGNKDITRYVYDSSNQLSAIKLPENLEILFKEYDENGRPHVMVDPDGLVYRYKYNFQGQVTELNKGGLRLQIEYDQEGHPVRITKADGTYIQADFDQAGDISQLSDNENNKINFLSDRENNTQTIQIYNALNELSLQRTSHYNNNGSITDVTLPDGRGVSYNYDKFDRIDSEKTLTGQTQTYAFDALGKVMQVVETTDDSKNILKQFQYDADDRIIGYRVGVNNNTRQYDDFGFMISTVDSSGKATVFRYDQAGRIIAKTSTVGSVQVFGYDSLGRLVSTGTALQPKQVTRIYKGTRLVAIHGKYQSSDYKFNVLGQVLVKRETLFGKEFVTKYEYAPENAKLVSTTLPDGQVLQYVYDAKSGKLAAVNNKGFFSDKSLLSAIEYQPFAGIQRYTLGNKWQTSLKYDTSGKLVNLKSSDFIDMSFDYDAAGHIRKIKSATGDEEYQYDRAGHMQSADLSGISYSWVYDAMGNRLQQKKNSEEETYHYETGSNKLLSVKSAGNIPYLYDASGNPLVVGKRRYKYNSAGQVTAVYIDDKLLASYMYNYRGQRILKTIKVNGVLQSTAYLYEQNKLSAEVNSDGKITSQYLYIGERLYAKLENSSIYYIHSDHINTPRVVTDEAGNIVWKAHYTPFGRAIIEKANITLNVRLQGQYYDQETNIHYNNYRYYDPDTGRYTTPDPLGVNGDLNNYVYANANPLQLTDSLGLYHTDMHYYMTYFLARMSGIEAEEALTIALAAFYIDENPQTQPLTADSNVLKSYHFTFDYDQANYGDNNADPLRRFWKDGKLNTQIGNLRDAAINVNLNEYESGANQGELLLPCTRAQLYGEFVHAFQDTYSHRYPDGKPIEVYNAEGLIGHALFGTYPDQTFGAISVSESWDESPGPVDEWILQGVNTKIWAYNEAHTLASEKELLAMFQQDFTPLYDEVWDDQLNDYVMVYNPTGGATGQGGIEAPVIQQGVFAGQQVSWDLLANTNADTGIRFGDAVQIAENEVLSGRLNPAGFPYDWQGQARNTWGKIVDDQGREISGVNPPMESYDIVWERKCDASYRASQGMPATSTCHVQNPDQLATSDPRSILQRFNQARTEEEKIDILNWFLIDAGFESIPAYDGIEAAKNRAVYLTGLDTPSNYQGVILPEPAPPMI